MDRCPTCHHRWGDCPYEPGHCAFIKTRDTDDREPDRRIWLAGLAGIIALLALYSSLPR